MKTQKVHLVEGADAATRDKSPATTPPTPNRCAAGESDPWRIRIDMDKQEAFIGETQIKNLRNMPFRVFAVLAAAPCQSLLPERLYEYAWEKENEPKHADPAGLISEYMWILNKKILRELPNPRVVRDNKLIRLQCQKRPKFFLTLNGQCLPELSKDPYFGEVVGLERLFGRRLLAKVGWVTREQHGGGENARHALVS